MCEDIKTAARQLSRLAGEAWGNVDGDDNAVCVNIMQFALNLLLAESPSEVERARCMFVGSVEPNEDDDVAKECIRQARDITAMVCRWG